MEGPGRHIIQSQSGAVPAAWALAGDSAGLTWAWPAGLWGGGSSQGSLAQQGLLAEAVKLTDTFHWSQTWLSSWPGKDRGLQSRLGTQCVCSTLLRAQAPQALE
jgi:hypothetical protein